jgi:PhzF family phenazine biosynthesis protein
MKMYQVDAFASRVFEGNPAAVCPLTQWLDDALLQRIAQEHNLSETAFFVPSAKGYALRWFTPVCEVDLCGHATLATAHIIFNILGERGHRIIFETRSGDLFVERCGNLLNMDFPASPATPCETPDLLVQALGLRPIEVWAGDDYMAIFASEDTVRSIVPDQLLLAQLNLRGVIITAPGVITDFVSRFFAPKFGVAEDPVTGSAHCTLTPYWANRLGKPILSARQVSKRSGNIACELKGNRVILSGSAVTFMEADIFI